MQNNAQSQVAGINTEPDLEQIRSPATFFGSRAGFEFLEKSRIRIRYEWYGVRMYVKAW